MKSAHPFPSRQFRLTEEDTYATRGDFQDLFAREMTNLFRLSLQLTAAVEKAESAQRPARASNYPTCFCQWTESSRVDHSVSNRCEESAEMAPERPMILAGHFLTKGGYSNQRDSNKPFGPALQAGLTTRRSTLANSASTSEFVDEVILTRL